jgi:uncharacterized protein (DUF3820 family)
MKMPFGKHKGTELETLIKDEPDYIVWLAENCKLTGELKTIIIKNYRIVKNEVNSRDEYIAQCESDEDYEKSWNGFDYE